jgi:hypothetical protein
MAQGGGTWGENADLSSCFRELREFALVLFVPSRIGGEGVDLFRGQGDFGGAHDGTKLCCSEAEHRSFQVRAWDWAGSHWLLFRWGLFVGEGVADSSCFLSASDSFSAGGAGVADAASFCFKSLKTLR